MRSGFSSYRSRLMGSVTALLGLGVISGCAPRTVTAVDQPQQPTPAPQPTLTQQPGDVYGTTEAVGEEDGVYQTPNSGVATTLAIGEEDGAYQTPNSGLVTTLAVGEEDGTGPIPVEPDGGIGDGAGPIPLDPSTQQEVGNVQGDFERIYIPPAPGSGVATTLAIGEEG